MAPLNWTQLLHASMMIAAIITTAACKPASTPEEPAAPPPEFDSAAAYEELENIVSFGSRAYGTAGHAHIAGYLHARLSAMGIETRVQAFTNKTAQGPLVFQNIEAVVPGQGGKIIIVSTHYDSMQGAAPDFQAANSAGSGPAVLLELARAAAGAYRGGPELRFVFFDGQEPLARHSSGDGLRGSSHYAEQLVAEKTDGLVIAVINLDLVGDRDLTITIPKNVSNAVRHRLLQASHKVGVRKHFKLFTNEIGDDHDPFYRRYIPAINIIDFEYGSEPGRNDYLRTDKDTIDKLSAESLGIVGCVTLALILDLAEKPDLPRD